MLFFYLYSKSTNDKFTIEKTIILETNLTEIKSIKVKTLVLMRN